MQIRNGIFFTVYWVKQISDYFFRIMICIFVTGFPASVISVIFNLFVELFAVAVRIDAVERYHSLFNTILKYCLDKERLETKRDTNNFISPEANIL